MNESAISAAPRTGAEPPACRSARVTAGLVTMQRNDGTMDGAEAGVVVCVPWVTLVAAEVA